LIPPLIPPYTYALKINDDASNDNEIIENIIIEILITVILVNEEFIPRSKLAITTEEDLAADLTHTDIAISL